MILYISFQAGKTFCDEEWVDGALWPNTPTGDTAINRTCPEGRVGYKSRTCDGTTWQLVFDYCVNEELNQVLNAADVSVASQLMSQCSNGKIQGFIYLDFYELMALKSDDGKRLFPKSFYLQTTVTTM